MSAGNTRKRGVLVFVLVLVVALAGCTGVPGGNNNDDTGSDQVSITTNDGLSIRFSSGTVEYFSNAADPATATFTADIENTGEKPATLQRLQLFRASWAADDSGSTETFQNQDNPKLPGVEKANNLAGGTYQKIFNPTINVDLQRGQSSDYTIGLRTVYTYMSETRSTLTLMSEDQYREEGRNQRQQMRNTIRGAPVHIRFTGKTPFPDRGQTISVPLEIRNVGDGGLKNDEIKNFKVSVEGTDIQTDCGTGGTVRLFAGNRPLSCDLDVDLSGGVPQQDFTVIASATYTYIEDDDTVTVTVVGEGESSTNTPSSGSDATDAADTFCSNQGFTEAYVTSDGNICVDGQTALSLLQQDDISGESFDAPSSVGCPNDKPKLVCTG